MTKYPYYIATIYDAGILKKIRFGIRDGRKFNTLADCTAAIKKRYENFPDLKNKQILILEYTDQYESKIIEICKGDEWISVDVPVRVMD